MVIVVLGVGFAELPADTFLAQRAVHVVLPTGDFGQNLFDYPTNARSSAQEQD